MTLSVIGNINVKDFNCTQCSYKISMFIRSDIIKCSYCGAKYILNHSTLCDQHIEYEYEFKGFECLYSNIVSGACNKICPVGGMFCKEHSSPENQDAIKSNIKYYQSKIEESEHKLHNMHESRKIWLIQEMSGIDEENDPIQENSNGEDSGMGDLDST